MLQRREHQRHVSRASGVAHHADAPHAACPGAQAAGDLDAEVLQQDAADAGVVDALRHADRGHGGQAVLLRGEQRQSERLQTGDQGAASCWWRAQRPQPLFHGQAAGLAQRVHREHRRGVMVDALAVPVAIVQREVEYQLVTGARRALIAAIARALTDTGAAPGGALRHFWLPL